MTMASSPSLVVFVLYASDASWGEILLVDEATYRNFAQSNDLDDSLYNIVSGADGVESLGLGPIAEAEQIAAEHGVGIQTV